MEKAISDTDADVLDLVLSALEQDQYCITITKKLPIKDALRTQTYIIESNFPHEDILTNIEEAVWSIHG